MSTNVLAPALSMADQVYNWILTGAAEHEILEGIKQYWPDAKPKPLIISAFERILQSGEADHGTIRGWCIEATRHVYRKALEAGDLATALRAIKQLHGFAS